MPGREKALLRSGLSRSQVKALLKSKPGAIAKKQWQEGSKFLGQGLKGLAPAAGITAGGLAGLGGAGYGIHRMMQD